MLYISLYYTLLCLWCLFFYNTNRIIIFYLPRTQKKLLSSDKVQMVLLEFDKQCVFFFVLFVSFYITQTFPSQSSHRTANCCSLFCGVYYYYCSNQAQQKKQFFMIKIKIRASSESFNFRIFCYPAIIIHINCKNTYISIQVTTYI